MTYKFTPGKDYHAYPEITIAAMNEKLYGPLRVYYLLYDIALEIGNPAMTLWGAHFSSGLEHRVREQQFQKTIARGMGIFWNPETVCGKPGIQLRSPSEVAEALGLPGSGFGIRRPRADLFENHRALTWEYVIAYEHIRGKLPPSQKRLRARTGKAERTQRLYKLQLGDHGVYNYEIMALFLSVEAARASYEYWIAQGRYQPHRHVIKVLNVMIADGNEIKLIGIFRKLPKSYRNHKACIGTNDLPLVAKHVRGAYTSGIYCRLNTFLPPGSAYTGLLPFEASYDSRGLLESPVALSKSPPVARL